MQHNWDKLVSIAILQNWSESHTHITENCRAQLYICYRAQLWRRVRVHLSVRPSVCHTLVLIQNQWLVFNVGYSPWTLVFSSAAGLQPEELIVYVIHVWIDGSLSGCGRTFFQIATPPTVMSDPYESWHIWSMCQYGKTVGQFFKILL